MSEETKVTQTQQKPSSAPAAGAPRPDGAPRTYAPRPGGENRGGGDRGGNRRFGGRRRFEGRDGAPRTGAPADPNRPAGENRGGGDRPFRGGGNRPGGFRRRPGDNRKKPEVVDSNIESQIIEVRRVSKTVKGGKKMKFSALVVAGDKEGGIGFGLAKGMDFQDAVGKATKKAKDSMVKIKLDENASVTHPVIFKYKAAKLFIKPAQSGTGLIAGGFLRSVLQLAGIQNVYSKVVGSNNKVVGVRAAMEALRDCYALSNAPVTAPKVAPVVA
jgi:small subunit ribosomal protein S5